MGLFDLFNTRPLTLNELMQVDAGRQERSQSLSVQLVDNYHKVKKETLWEKIRNLFKRSARNGINMYYVILKFNVTNIVNGNSYTVLIEFQPNPDMNALLNNRVKIYCDCASFKYQSAYLLNKKGSLFRSAKTDLNLGRALTDAPDIRKTKTSNLCKHSYACVTWMVNNINYLMSII